MKIKCHHWKVQALASEGQQHRSTLSYSDRASRHRAKPTRYLAQRSVMHRNRLISLLIRSGSVTSLEEIPPEAEPMDIEPQEAGLTPLRGRDWHRSQDLRETAFAADLSRLVGE